jgi:hypothetical protein
MLVRSEGEYNAGLKQEGCRSTWLFALCNTRASRCKDIQSTVTTRATTKPQQHNKNSTSALYFLVPFAGISLIRFNGSRLRGLSLLDIQ